MEITSPPATVTERVRYITVGFTSGEGRQFTLFDTDTYTEAGQEIIIETVEPPEKVTIYRAALAWKSIIVGMRTREIEETVDERRTRIAQSGGENRGSGTVDSEAGSGA